MQKDNHPESTLVVCVVPRAATSVQAGGFTLVEVMVGLALFCLASAGTYSLLLTAYQTAVQARTSDQVRAVLRSIGDDFMRMPYADASGTILPLFSKTNEFTGDGLAWAGIEGATPGLELNLGSEEAGLVPAVFMRKVSYIDLIDGEVNDAPIISPGGTLIQLELIARFRAQQRTITQSLVLIRASP